MLVVFVLTARYRQTNSREIATGKTQDVPLEFPGFSEILLIGAIALAFFYSQLVGLRVLGIVLIGYGVWTAWVRKIPFGIEGQKPVGHITGAPAIIFGLMYGGIGAFLLLQPELISNILNNAK